MNKQPKQGGGTTPKKTSAKESKPNSDKKSEKPDKKNDKPWLSKGKIVHNDLEKRKDKKLDINAEGKLDTAGGGLSARKSSRNQGVEATNTGGTGKTS